MKKYYWANKWVFILAAIWSAAGLWNLWRFPFQVYDNWWAAFIIAYLTILFFMGLGLLVWEIALWQKTESWAPWAFWEVNKYLKWIWWASIFTAAVILSYYSVVIWWSLDYLWYSIIWLFNWWNLAWTWNVSDFFYKDILNLTWWVNELWNISKPVFIWTIITWILIYLFTRKSTKSVWKVVLVTATLPFITLAILAFRWATLPWASEWLQYLINIDYSKLKDINTWIAAAWQIFFTLSLSMWIMIAYWALKKKDSEIVKATFIVALWNTLVSILSAIAVFWTLWFLALKKWVAIQDVVAWWPGLVFVTIPETISLLPWLQALFAVIFFITIFLLAIDSAMSLVEAVWVALRNNFKKIKIEKLSLIIVVLLWLSSVIYTFWNGLYVLDIVDHFITSYSMLFIWVLEALILICFWKKLGKFIDDRNKCYWKMIINKYYFLLTWIISLIVLTYLLIKNIEWGINYDSYKVNYLMFYGVYVLIFVYWISILLNLLSLRKK